MSCTITLIPYDILGAPRYRILTDFLSGSSDPRENGQTLEQGGTEEESRGAERVEWLTYLNVTTLAMPWTNNYVFPMPPLVSTHGCTSFSS
jgi:hypothetical protein